MTLQIQSPAFQAGQAIPSKYTCERENLAPALSWSGLPKGAQSLALIVDDPDAPDPAAPKRTYVHWVAFNLPASASGIPEGGKLPEGAQSGLNDWQREGYGGPCPPIGRHRYFFKLYALDTALSLERPTKAQLEAAMTGHILAQAALLGTYQKSR